ncbi:MAG TPA: YeeE/YedE thiosulfate transporter family protein [Azospirillum sp.]|nr:YeeE/YedE thiosulfate transporter family protein [Azospirillum sp.]
MVIENFTPVAALLGGALIGIAATLLLLLNGRLAGVSGIAGRLLLSLRPGDVAWRVMFLLGLVVGAGAYGLVASPAIRIDASLPVVVLGGLLVGFGTQLGSGCTSGHGVCGIARLSPRSIIATLVFMICGGVTVFLVRHIIGG